MIEMCCCTHLALCYDFITFLEWLEEVKTFLALFLHAFRGVFWLWYILRVGRRRVNPEPRRITDCTSRNDGAIVRMLSYRRFTKKIKEVAEQRKTVRSELFMLYEQNNILKMWRKKIVEVKKRVLSLYSKLLGWRVQNCSRLYSRYF